MAAAEREAAGENEVALAWPSLLELCRPGGPNRLDLELYRTARAFSLLDAVLFRYVAGLESSSAAGRRQRARGEGPSSGGRDRGGRGDGMRRRRRKWRRRRRSIQAEPAGGSQQDEGLLLGRVRKGVKGALRRCGHVGRPLAHEQR